MKTLFITGNPWADLTAVSDRFSNGGMKPAAELQIGAIHSLEQWHESIGTGNKKKRVGRAWELAASQLFLANIDKTFWGISSHRIVWLLDFWAKFDDSIKFVFVYNTPAEAVQRIISDGNATEEDVGNVLSDWGAYNTEMLKFYSANEERCIWISQSDVALDEQSTFTALSTKFNLECDSVPGSHVEIVTPEPGIIEKWLGKQLAGRDTRITAISENVEKLLPPSPSKSKVVAEKNFFSEVLSQLRKTQQEMQRNQLKILNLEEQASNQHNTIAELTRANQQLNRDTDCFQTTLAEVENRYQTVARENLALKESNSQLHRTTQRIESDLQAKEILFSETVSELRRQLGAAATERRTASDLEEKANAVLQAKQDEIDCLRSENTFLIGEMHATQVDLINSTEQIAELIRETSRLTKTIDFLKSQVNPSDYFSFDRIESDSASAWTAHDFSTYVCSYDKVQLSISTEADDFIVRTVSEGCAFAAAPSDSHDAGCHEFSVRVCSKTLSIVDSSIAGTSAHYLAATICAAISTAVGEMLSEEYRRLLLSLRTHLKSDSELLYDKAVLKREERHGDYENLAIVLKNASFRAKYWNDFEFRFAAARISNFGFSSLPRLEFPATSQSARQFEGWYAESEDHLGPKYELRFDTAGTAIDVDAWRALTESDRSLMTCLINQLPQMIIKAVEDGEPISRPSEEWKWLADSTKRTFHVLSEAQVLN